MAIRSGRPCSTSPSSHPIKASTDVVVIGKAYAPRGRRDGADDGRRAGRRQEEGARGDWRSSVQLPRGRRAGIHRSRAVHRDGDPLRPRVRRTRRRRAFRIFRSCIRATSWAPGSCCATSRKPLTVLPLPNIEDPEDLLTPERLFIERAGPLAPSAAAAGIRLAAAHVVSALCAARSIPAISRSGHRDRRRADGAAAAESRGARQAVEVAADGGAVRERRVARDDLRKLQGR